VVRYWNRAAVADKQHMLAIRDRRSLVDKVHSALREMILSGEIEDGEKIVIDRMARSLAVSATPVREALARLASDGLVKGIPHQGYVVAAIWDVRSFDAMLEARMLIEPHSAAVAARRVREHTAPGLVSGLENDLDKMDAVLRDLEQGGSQPDGYRRFARYDRELHERIVGACQNPLLDDLNRRLRPHPHVVRVWMALGIERASLDEHRAILAGIKAGDEQVAEEAMRLHVINTGVRLRPGTVGTDPVQE